MNINTKIADWTNRINQSTKDFKAQFADLTVEQLNWKPDASVWSIGQNIDHLIKINSSYFPVLVALKKNTLKLPLIARISFINNFFGNFLIKSVNPESRKKVKTLSIWQPPISEISTDILPQFEKNQKELIQKIQEN